MQMLGTGPRGDKESMDTRITKQMHLDARQEREEAERDNRIEMVRKPHPGAGLIIAILFFGMVVFVYGLGVAFVERMGRMERRIEHLEHMERRP